LATASSPDSAGDLYLLDGGTTRRLTDFSAALRAQADLTELQEVTATGADGYPVHGWVAVPAGLGPHPVLLLIHRGPRSHYPPPLFRQSSPPPRWRPNPPSARCLRRAARPG